MKQRSSIPLHVLFLEDDPSDVTLMLRGLSSAGFTPDWKVVQTRQDYEAQLGLAFDVILADYTLPDLNALLALKLLQERDLDIPFIVVTGSVGEETAAECIKQGASDYLSKDRLERLGEAVRRALYEKKQRDEKNAVLMALKEGEEKYRHLFEMESDALLLVARQTGQIMEANAAAVQLYGYSQEGLLKKNITDLLAEPNENRDTAGELATRAPLQYHRKKDGTVFPVEITGSFLTWWGNEVRLAAIRDITQWAEAEKALLRINHAYRTIRDCSQALIRISDEQELLDKICRIIVEVGGFKMAWVGFAELDEAKTVRPVAWAGNEKGYLKTTEITWRSDEPSSEPAGIAIRAGAPCTIKSIEDPIDHAPWRSEANRRGYVSAIALPLMVDGPAFGALSIYADESDTFDSEETQLLMGLAEDLAYSIRTLQEKSIQGKAELALRDSEQRYRNLFDHSVSGIALHKIITDKNGAPIDYIFLEVNQAFEKLTGLDSDEIIGKPVTETLPGIEADPFIGIYGQVAATSEPIHFEEYSTPLGRYYEITAFSPFKGQFATIFTDITERKKAEADNKKHMEGIRLLHEAGQQLSSTLDPKSVYHTVYEVVSKVMDCHCLLISTYDSQKRMIDYVYGWHKGQLLDNGKISNSQFAQEGYGLQNEVIRTGEPILIQDIQTQAKGIGVYCPGYEDGLMRSALAVPLKLDEQVVGTIQVLSSRPDTYNEDDLRFLEALGVQAAVARKNALLYQQAQIEIAERQRAEAAEREHRTLAEALRDTITALISPGDTPTTMTRILENVGRVVPHDAANLMLVEEQAVRIDYLRNYPPHLDAVLRNYTHSLANFPLLEKMIETGKPVLVSDTTQESTFPQVTEGWANSYIGAPIRVYGVVIGFLNLHSTALGFFTSTHAERLQAFADQVALALENAQLYETLRRQTDDLKVRIEHRTAELRRAKEHVEAILNNSSDAILVLNKKGQIKQANPAFGRLFGHGGDSIYGNPLAIYADQAHQNRLEQALSAITKRRQAKRTEFVARRRDNGRLFDAEINLSLIASDEHASDIVCILRDITQRKRAEEELRKALEKERELGELKSRFISVASHEFRTPLTTILSSASWLEVAGERMTVAKRIEHLQKIQTAARNMTELTEDVLTFSKTEAKHLAFTPMLLDLKVFVQSIVDEFKLLAGSTQLLFSQTGHHTQAMIDERLLRLIVSNLLSNALKYSPKGEAVRLDLACQKRKIVLKVTDNGLGIPEKDHPYIYDAFHRATNVSAIPGTGLGLSITREAVMSCGGTITFESEVGVGTTFIVILPIKPLKEHP